MEKEEQFYKYVKSLFQKTNDKKLIGELAEKFMNELEQKEK